MTNWEELTALLKKRVRRIGRAIDGVRASDILALEVERETIRTVLRTMTQIHPEANKAKGAVSSMPLRIAFDVDGVLRNLVCTTLDRYNEVLGACGYPLVAESDITCFDKLNEIFRPVVSLDAPAKSRLLAFLDKYNIWREAPPYPEFVAFWNRLAGGAYHGKVTPLIVSANSGAQGMQQTLAWLHANLVRPVVGGWEIHFTNDKTTVLYDALIDDRPQTIERAVSMRKQCGADIELFMPNRTWTESATDLASTLLPAPDAEGVKTIERWIDTKLR